MLEKIASSLGISNNINIASLNVKEKIASVEKMIPLIEFDANAIKNMKKPQETVIHNK
ncbi:MAG: hypothetical protein HQK53_11760 [Oligoflexia bacterium]|nr:hypothetical protein [Oligoflexia bacterium]